MKEVVARDFVAQFFVLRTPLLPWDLFRDWGQNTTTQGLVDDSQLLDDALKADDVILERRLVEEISKREVREAIRFASESLDVVIDTFAAGQHVSNVGVRRALVRYFSRMTSRATPFGAFAGISLGRSGSRTSLTLASRQEYRLHVRLDHGFTEAVLDYLLSQKQARNGFVYNLNTSLYRAGDKFRYVETLRASTRRTHRLATVDPTPFLEATLDRARKGATHEALVTALIDEWGVTYQEGEEYLSLLIENQLLVPSFAPTLTGGEALRPLVSRLRELAQPDANRLASDIEFTLSDTVQALKSELAETHCKEFAKRIRETPLQVDHSRLFQVDMTKPAAQHSPGLTIGKAALKEIARSVEILHRIGAEGPPPSLAEFCLRFRERYDAREVPLVMVLDDELGIGFGTDAGLSEPSPLLAGLHLPSAPPKHAVWESRHAHLLNLLTGAIRGDLIEVALSEQDVRALETPVNLPLPDSFYVHGTLVAKNAQALDSGKFEFFVEGAAGPSGIRLLGRFCDLDPALQTYAMAHVKGEESLQPDAIFAEVVHLPSDRAGNVLHRPHLRQYEIPYLGVSGVATDRQIMITDLLVSVVGERIVLRSSRLGREVIPRLSSAHNFAKGLTVYRFLCTLQAQNLAHSMNFGWGPLRTAPFLPRIRVGRIVLSRAQWRIPAGQILDWSQLTRPVQLQRIRQYRELNRVPRFVSFVDGEVGYAIDFENALSVDNFVHSNRTNGDVVVREMTTDDQLCVRGPEGKFLHEIIVPFARRQTPARPPPPILAEVSGRRFLPGGDWLYFKIYGGSAAVESVLQGPVRAVVQSALETRSATNWFFVRYADPEWHLRLRFHGDSERLLKEVLPRMKDALAALPTDTVWRVQVDTYEREIERYGGAEGIAIAESLFGIDSDASLEMLASLPRDNFEDWRWMVALLSLDRLMSDFGLAATAKVGFTKNVRDSFAREFNSDGQMNSALGVKFRQAKDTIESLLFSPLQAPIELSGCFGTMERRSKRNHELAIELREIVRRGGLTCSFEYFLGSIMHMNTNRITRRSARLQEFVLYDSLYRAHSSRLARIIAGS